MSTTSSRALRLLSVLSLASGACTGRISQVGGSPSTGAASTAGMGGGTITGVGGSTGAGGTSDVVPLGTDPGRVTIHRLNRTEYNNTIRDLLGTTARPADAFPPDDLGLGFDNIADVLSLSPVHLTLYQSAAETLVTAALAGAQRSKILTCDAASMGATCVRSVLRAFGRRAWRRPVTDAEIDHLMTVATLATTNGDGWEQGVALALQSMLVSPNFLFRVELDTTPTSMTPHALTSYELAARLSYFVWSSMPDDALSTAADAGMLSTKAQLTAQVARMLKDPKASALVDNFAGQWLYTRLVDDVQPDATLFPQFDAPLRDALKQETTLMVKDIMFGGVPADQLLLADYTYANDRLAKHYGLPALTGSTMQKVTLPADSHRGGFLTQASFLTVTSHPTSTSPVLRGKWILGQLMCQEISPPPNAAMAVLQPPATGTTQTLRQRLETHHKNPCAVCHVVMDPLGFGLESYDAVGQFRTTDNTLPIDSSGVLPDGRTFNGALELESVVAKDPGFAKCVTQKLYTYALGRAPQSTTNHMDPAVLQQDADAFRAAGYPMTDLITAIVTGDTFTQRRGDPTVATGGAQ
jgi:Protein of unknown function (DUF1592)/Protein of unknown function (DUF1588)/Protein of unknown function (DUF1587)/Protein of unknown function (DUF1595)/Protein of unknown function (DUF1585)